MNCRLRTVIGWVLAGFALLAGWSGASAQEVTNVGRPGFAEDYPAYRLSFLQRATDLMGTEVRDRENRKLGTIADLVVDCSSWRVVCALVAPANLYGATEYFVAIPARSFLSADTNRAVVDVTMTNLLGLPLFKSAGWDGAAVYKSMKDAYARFNQPVFWGETSGLGRLARCGNVLDMEVNNGNVNVGQLTDLMVDLPAERVMFALVAFYGLEQNLHAVPAGALTLDTNESNFQLKVEPRMVGGLVNREDSLWLELGDPAWAAADYGAFSRELSFNPPAAETLALARKFVREYVPPPPKVKVAEVENPDLVVTRNIWTAILEGDIENGAAAQSMKVVTVNGQVTLTGQVGTEKDRSTFGAIAEGVAGAGRVRNELEVK